MNTLKQWLKQSSAEQKSHLADLAMTSIPSLRLAAHGYRTDGEVSLTAEFAQRIVSATELINDPALPKIKPEHLCTACASCSYQLQCNKA